MTFVESILREIQPVIPDLVRNLALHAVGGCPFGKKLFKLHQRVQALLAHCFAQRVGLAPGEFSHLDGNPHHLFLINGDTIGFLQDLLHHGMVVNHLFPLVFARYIGIDEFHRAGPVKRHHGDQVFKLVWLQVDKIFAHAVAFKLENAVRIPIAKKLVHLLIAEVKVVDVQFHTVGLAHQIYRFLDNGEGFQPQDVHFEELQFVQPFSFVLHQDVGVGIFLVAAGERNVFFEVARRDHQPGSVDTGLADQPFKHDAVFVDALIELVTVDQVPEIRRFFIGLL
ncbi:MAG: hypothetical protein BWX83_00619 [Candidatus Cloacimonetes bacterium ADurb.Bin117]|nr:MAG: hypothetical protein BWX83_00619 [Candidatus Cloacimonetes bacterium ADurb.Bin117]